ncbi:MAG: hypothetical protein ABWX74_15765 [Aeromicrobium sp.]
MTLSRPVVVSARCIRHAAAALACVVLVGSAALHAFDSQYGRSASSPPGAGSSGAALVAELTGQDAVTRWMPSLRP